MVTRWLIKTISSVIAVVKTDIPVMVQSLGGKIVVLRKTQFARNARNLAIS